MAREPSRRPRICGGIVGQDGPTDPLVTVGIVLVVSAVTLGMTAFVIGAN